MKPLGYLHVRPYIRLTFYPAVIKVESVLMLSLSKLLVTLFQSDEQVNTHATSRNSRHLINIAR